MNVESLIRQAFQYFKQGDNKNALRFYREALVIDPKCSTALLGCGISLADMGNGEEAIEYFSQAIQFDASNADAFSMRSLAFFQLGNLENALNDSNRAINLEPNVAGHYRAKAEILLALDQYSLLPEALACFEQVLKLEPNDADAQKKRDFLLDGLNRDRLQAQVLQSPIQTVKSNNKNTEVIQESLLESMAIYEETFFTIFNDIVDELKDRWQYPPSEMEKSDKFLSDTLKKMDILIKQADNEFEALSVIHQMTDGYAASYYHIKAIKSGLASVYPISNPEKMDESSQFFSEAKKFAEKSQDKPKLVHIAHHQEKLEERNDYELRKAKKSEDGNNKALLGLGIGAFGFVLLLGGQYWIAFVCFGISWWACQS